MFMLDKSKKARSRTVKIIFLQTTLLCHFITVISLKQKYMSSSIDLHVIIIHVHIYQKVLNNVNTGTQMLHFTLPKIKYLGYLLMLTHYLDGKYISIRVV